MRECVYDIEADDLDASEIHCLSYSMMDSDEVHTLFDYDDIRDLFEEDFLFVGHNIKRYDNPTLQRLLDITGLAKRFVVDTLAVSWYLNPSRKKHSLEIYGDEFGIKKREVNNWKTLPKDVYKARCETDVLINKALWKEQKKHLLEIYEDPQELTAFLKYLDFKMYCAHLAEASRWRLDIERCQEALKRLSDERNHKTDELRARMPRVPDTRKYSKPQQRVKANGEPTSHEEKWQLRLKQAGLPKDYEGEVELIVGYDEPNPGSHEQIKSWLFSLGWQPTTIKQVRNKNTGEIKEIPQIYKERGEGSVCDSVKKLFDVEPALHSLDSMGILSHRIGILSGFLRDVSSEGFVTAKIAGLTNTLRFKHAEIVNLPKPEVPYGEDIRGCLIARDGYELCGADKSGLEDRLKQHFIFPHDPDYVRDLQSDDYDPHLDIAVLAGMMSSSDAEAYKQGDHSKKSVRSVAKNGNYASQYGAGIPRLMVTCGISRGEARHLHKTYWERNWAIKAVADEQEIKEVRGQMYLKNPISGFWYSLRFEKDIFSTLVQGSASYCFDIWVSFILDERPQLTAQFHDEVVLEVRKGYQDEVREFLRKTVNKTNDLLRLNVDLDIGVAFGDRYSEIH